MHIPNMCKNKILSTYVWKNIILSLWITVNHIFPSRNCICRSLNLILKPIVKYVKKHFKKNMHILYIQTHAILHDSIKLPRE